jgi:ABC-type multidrug transport system fused ATPase/permease subunit
VLDRADGRVTFDGVWFDYDPALPVLRDVRFEVAAGQTVALVGRTGAGKTTIANLIPRFYDVTSGRVLIDGHDVREVELGSLRRQIGIVMQETTLFSGTIRENIAFGKADATDEDIEWAARSARADEFIARLPKGYETRVGERGVSLSGCQKQRVAIARALAMQPKLMLFDEPTSALDPELVGDVLDAMRQLARDGMTMVVVTHEIGFAREVGDTLVFMDDGVIVETGKPREVLANARHERTRSFLSKVL